MFLDDRVFLVDTRSPSAMRRDQQHVPCHLHAQMALRLALAHGKDWIRVAKPGHSCDFAVAALREQMRRDPWGTPRNLVNAPLAEHLRLGATLDIHHPNWRGASLQPLRHGG